MVGPMTLRPAMSAKSRWSARLLVVFIAMGCVSTNALAAGERDCNDKMTLRGEVQEKSLTQWHNPDIAKVSDFGVCFAGYVSNFAGKTSDLDDDGEPDVLRIPLFVAHRVDRAEAKVETRKRPTRWFTVDELVPVGIAPTDQSYVFSQQWRAAHADWYERGHLAQKYLLERIGPDAAWFSHNLANAVPQRGRFNKTVWLDLECRVGAWANQYKKVWVIAGPVFQTGAPQSWLKEPQRPARPVAIPDAMFKIVLRQDDRDTWHALAFVMPQQDTRYELGAKKWDLLAWGSSIDQIERLTRQKFLPGVADNAPIRKARTKELWPHKAEEFDPPCRKFIGART